MGRSLSLLSYMVMVEVSVCIVNYNTKERLKECLDSLYSQTRNIDYEVIVVDNNSADGSVEMLKQLYPGTILISNRLNLGFGQANNQAIEQSQGEYLLFLNPDTRLLTDVISTLRDFLQAHPKAGAVGCRLLNPDGSLQTSGYRFPTLVQALGNLFMLNRVLPYQFLRGYFGPVLGKIWGQFDPHDRLREVDYVTGACLMVRRKALQEIGYFDPAFFLYFEEKDLCLRLKRAGWQIYFTPEASVIHYLGGASKLCPEISLYHRYRSMVYFFQKHYRWQTGVLLRCILIMGSLFRMALALANSLIQPRRWGYLKRAIRLWGSVLRLAITRDPLL